MTFLPSLLSAGLMGFIGGCLFFTILWISARKLLTSERPITWFIGGLFTRVTLVVAGFYWVANGNWQLLLACLFGFILGRWLISKVVLSRFIAVKTATKMPTELAAGVNRAS